jgi:2Fe-2S ferredoxin
MLNITYIEHDGTVHQVEAELGLTLMEGAVNNEVPGIEAQCGGGCSCATCHVYVDPAWEDKLPEQDAMERAMLDMSASGLQGNSRLSCQITLTDELEGLVVQMPEFQG